MSNVSTNSREDTVLPDEDETSKSFAILDFIFNLIQNKSRWQKKNVYGLQKLICKVEKKQREYTKLSVV